MEQLSRAHYVYVLECSDGSLYTGWTTNVLRRVQAHNSGKGAKYTRTRLPVSIQLIETYGTKPEALRREHEIKQMSRRQKQLLIQSANDGHQSNAPDTHQPDRRDLDRHDLDRHDLDTHQPDRDDLDRHVRHHTEEGSDCTS